MASTTFREDLLGALRRTLSSSRHLSFEWSFRIGEHEARSRDELICWVRHERVRATEELGKCRRLLSEFSVLDEVPDDRIQNLGIGVGPGGRVLYLHRRVPGGQPLYQAFDGDRVRHYRFHHFPCTPELVQPRDVVCGDLRPLFDRMAGDPRVQAMSGFWLRSRVGQPGIDQVCLSFTHRPGVRELWPALRTWTAADLRPFQDEHVKHLAFNADGSLTAYVGASTRGFPESVDDLRRQVRAGSRESSRRTARQLRGITMMPRARHDFLDEFYSPQDIPGWRRLLGPEMFYHFGLFAPHDDIQDIWNDRPFARAAEDLCRHIEDGERVYDLGCGWGGLSRHLQNERHCQVLGATISRTQFQHCHRTGVPCRYTDMETSLPPGPFDTILMCESLEHVVNKFALLKRLRRFGRRLVIRTSTQELPARGPVFGDSMRVVSSDCLRELLTSCGYRIVHLQDRRAESMPTIDVWKARLDAVPIPGDAHHAAWKAMVNRVSANKAAWARAHPLLDIVAV